MQPKNRVRYISSAQVNFAYGFSFIRMKYGPNILIFPYVQLRINQICHHQLTPISLNRIKDFVYWEVRQPPILQSDHCWRVGNETSINALKDWWLPNFPTNKILSSVQENWGDLMVSDLINSELNIWKYEDIITIFHKEEAEAICQIPLSWRNVSNTVFWLHNSRGLFTAKSAYHVARRLLIDDNRVETSRGCAAKNV